MKTFLLFLTAIILFSISSYGQMKYWEDLNDQQKSDILGVCKSVSIKRFYKGKFKTTDDERTWKLIDEILDSNDTILPLTFYLFNKICAESDGAESEVVAGYCAKFLAKHPLYILTYFSRERILKVKEPVWKRYASFVGCELYFNIYCSSNLEYSNKSNKRYKEILVSASKGNKENEETFRVFWQMVDKTIKMMESEGGSKVTLNIEFE